MITSQCLTQKRKGRERGIDEEGVGIREMAENEKDLHVLHVPWL